MDFYGSSLGGKVRGKLSRKLSVFECHLEIDEGQLFLLSFNF